MSKKQLALIDFQLLFESLPGLFIILLPDNFKIAAVSEDYLAATFTKREDIVYHEFFIVFSDSASSTIRNSLNTVIKEKITHTMEAEKYSVHKPDGSTEEQFWSGFNKPVLDSKKEVKFIIHYMKDETTYIKLKKAEEETRRLNEELEKKVIERTTQLQAVNKELESFSYSVSHDLRAPLRAVDGYSKMIQEDYNDALDEEGKRLLEVVQYNAQKMGALIDDLLAFSRLGKKELQKTVIDMEELTEGALMELNKMVEHKAEIKIKKLYPVKADYSLMNQVMINLISNAIKYSSKKEKSMVEISAYEKNGEIIFSVSDNGVGFDMQYAGKLFGVFQRLHTMEDFEGTGVGLAIVQRIINKHNGRVWAESKVEQGATFYFALPGLL